MNIIKLKRVSWDTALRLVKTEDMYINTMHIHLFKSTKPTSEYIIREYPELTLMTVGHEYIYVAETPQEIQKTINYLHQ